MINQYLQMKENYDDIDQDGYDMERFKGLPFHPSYLTLMIIVIFQELMRLMEKLKAYLMP